jgi:three-Cys-motif partner protein
MVELPHSVEGQRLAFEQLPSWAPHHAAKHALLREYINAWFPKLGFTYRQTVVIDAFASTGRYGGKQPGSPLVLLQAYTGRSDRHRFKAPPHFIFIESELRFARHLRAEVDAIGDLRGARVDVLHGTYEQLFPQVVTYLRSTYLQPLPVFAFVDPRGYSETPFALLQDYRRRLGEKAEAMVYLPVNFMARFVMTDLTQNALERCFGGGDAVERVRANPDCADFAAGDRIAAEYQSLMRNEFGLVTQFTIDPIRHNEYHLFFGTGNLAGVRAMKEAYWNVDPVGGAGYVQDPGEAAGQGSLFDLATTKVLPPEQTLVYLMREHFGKRKFTFEEAAEWVLLNTRFRDRPHMRQMVFLPEQAARRLEVVVSTRRSIQHFPEGTVMRFVD